MICGEGGRSVTQSVKDERVAEECHIPPAPDAAMLMNKEPICMGISYCASKSLVEVLLSDMMTNDKDEECREKGMKEGDEGGVQ